MFCSKCKNLSSFKIFDFCECRTEKGRFSLFCEPCFMKIFSSDKCTCGSKKSYVIREFTWENAFKVANSLKEIFRMPIEHTYKESDSSLIYPLADDEKSLTTIESVRSFPYNLKKYKPDGKFYGQQDVYLYIKNSSEEKYFILRSENEWVLRKSKKQVYTFAIKSESAYIYLDNLSFVLSKKIKLSSSEKGTKFTITSKKNIKHEDHSLYFFDGKIVKSDVKKEGYKKILFMKRH